MEAYIWLILASMLAVGVLLGFFIGRNKGDTSAPRVKELEESLAQADQDMQQYRGQVTGHFEKTATLFNQLTNDYREVYEHLANSSEQLCGDQVAKLKGLTAETKVLEGEGEKMESSTAEAASEAKPVAEEASAEPQAVTEEISAEPESSLESKPEAEPEAETEVSPAVAEAATIEEKAVEARTIH